MAVSRRKLQDRQVLRVVAGDAHDAPGGPSAVVHESRDRSADLELRGDVPSRDHRVRRFREQKASALEGDHADTAALKVGLDSHEWEHEVAHCTVLAHTDILATQRSYAVGAVTHGRAAPPVLLQTRPAA